MFAARCHVEVYRSAIHTGLLLVAPLRQCLRCRYVVSATLILLGMSLLGTMAVAADTLPPPQGKVLLRISGAIDRPNVGEEFHFDRAMLDALPLHSYRTKTPWDKGWHIFEGVLLRDVLDAAGARSATFEAIGVDDYRAMFDGIDIRRDAVMLAYRQNDKDLTIRTLGPLRIMFPFSDIPEYFSQSTMAAAVWQVVAMDVQ